MDYIREYRKRHPRTDRIMYRCIVVCPLCKKEVDIQKGARKNWKNCRACGMKNSKRIYKLRGRQISIRIGGLTVPEIAAKYGVGVHAVYKRIRNRKGDFSVDELMRGVGRRTRNNAFFIYRGEEKTVQEIATIIRMSKSHVFTRLKGDPNYYNR